MSFGATAGLPATSSWDEQLESGGNVRFHDHQFGVEAVKLLPGEFYVTADDIMLVTVLGSCVSACLRDADTGIGGMNHFMLPETECGPEAVSARYGSFAMEILINEMMKLGAARSRLQAKVFGGGTVLKGFTVANVGERNIEFVRNYLAAEHIPIVAEDLGDVYPRKIHFFPRSGRALVKRLAPTHSREELSQERAYTKRMQKHPPAEGAVELFDS